MESILQVQDSKGNWFDRLGFESFYVRSLKQDIIKNRLTQNFNKKITVYQDLGDKKMFKIVSFIDKLKTNDKYVPSNTNPNLLTVVSFIIVLGVILNARLK